MVIFKLVTYLLSIILIVLSTVNLQCQGQFVCISLRPILRTPQQLMSHDYSLVIM